mgnify:FL=1
MELLKSHNLIALLVSAFLFVGLLGAVLFNAWAYPFALLLLLAGGTFFLQYPKRTFLILLFLRIVVDLMHFLPSIGGLNILELFSGGSTAVCLILIAHRFRTDIEFHPAILFFFIWNFTLIFQLFNSPATLSSAVDFLKSFSPVLLLPLCSSIFTQRGDGLKIMRYLAWAGAVPILSSLYFLAAGQMNDPDMVLHGIPRLLGGYKNLRHHGLIMLIIALLGVFQWAIAENKRSKSIWTVYTLGAVVCLYLTMIRSSLLPFVIAVALFSWMTKRKWVVYVLGVLVFIGIFTSETLQDRFKDFILIFTLSRETDIDQLAKLGSGRYALWTSSFEAWMNKGVLNQMLGLGYGAHTELTNSAFFAFDAASNKDLDPHNDILYMLYDLGPLSLFSYMGMTWMGTKACFTLHKLGQTWQEKQLGAICACSMIALTINNLISNGTVKRVTIGWMFWVFAGIAYGTLKYYRIQQKQHIKRTAHALPSEQNSFT